MFWSIVGLALAGALVWLLYVLFFYPQVHFACLPVAAYDPGTVPPIPFQQEDVEAFRRAGASDPDMADLGDLQTSDNIGLLANRLKGIVTGSRDTLILYVSAHGVSHDGTPYLLCSDFLRREGVAGRYRLGELLEQVRRCPAKLKLVVLDAGQITRDPRLGMLVNEFSHLLHQELRPIDDSSLWLLTAHGPFQRPHVCYGMNRSIFAWYVTEGLEGKADADGNGLVQMAELFRFVRRGVADWVYQQSSGRHGQTVQLFHAGQGLVDPPENIDLLKISDLVREDSGNHKTDNSRGAAETPAQEDPAEEKTAAAESPPQAGAAEGSGTAEGESAAARLRVRKLLRDAWKFRDDVRRRAGPHRWTPVDYAPHLWRKFEEMLLGYEQRYRSGETFAPDDVAGDLAGKILPCRELLESDSAPPIGRTTVLWPLAAARRQFLQAHANSGLLTTDDRHELAIIEAIQLRNDLFLRSPYYVRWHAAASRSLAAEHRLHRTIVKLLGELREFNDRLESMEDAELRGADRSEMLAILEDLNARVKPLRDLQRSIEEDGLQKDALDVIDKPGGPGNAEKIEALLSTPCLPAQRRLELLEAVEQLEQPSPDAGGPSAEPDTAGAGRWQRLAEQARLEALLVALADPAAGLTLPDETSRSDDSEALWAGYRKLGSELGAFYAGMAAKVNRWCSSDEPATVRAAARLLRLLDARDADHVPYTRCGIAVRAIALREPDTRRLVLKGPPETLPLNSDPPTPVEFTIESTDLSSNEAEVTVEYGPGLVVKTPDDRALLAGQPMKFTLSHADVPFRCTVSGNETVDDASLLVTVTCDGITASKTATFKRPPPDRVDLLVHRTAAGDEYPVVGIEDYRLRPFPNRVTAYRLELVNQSRKKRRVSVQVVAMPKLSPYEPLTREVLLADSGELRSNVELLTPPLQMDLPADADPKKIPFPAPKKAEEAPEGATDGPDAAQGPARLPIPSRLALVIRDLETNEAKWIKRLTIVPYAPRNYLDCRVSYNARRHEIIARLGLSDPERIPPELADNPVKIDWQTAGLLDPNTPGNREGTLAAPDDVAILTATVAPERERLVRVHLKVDRYPRAFIYHVRCDRDRESIARNRSLAEVRIIAPQPDEAYLVPMEEPMMVELEVDAPENAFRESGDVVEVGIDADGDGELRDEKPLRFYSDRQVVLHIEEMGPEGVLKIDARLDDFRFPLDSAGWYNKKVGILSQLVLPNSNLAQGPIADSASVEVIFDGASPDFKVSADRWEVFQGETFNISVKISDGELSGVKQIIFGLDLDTDGKLQEEEQPKKVSHSDAEGIWRHKIPTKNLSPGVYQLRVIATDRAGNDPGEQMHYLTVKKPPPETGGGPLRPRPATSTVEGTVVLKGGQSLSRIVVTLEGTSFSFKTGPAGTFRFEEVPHGKYELHAKGTAKGKFVEGTKEIVLPGAKEPFEVKMELEW